MEVLDLEKKILLLNLIDHEPETDNFLIYAKDPFEAKYQLLINKRENTDLKYLSDLKAFIQYSNSMHDIYKNNEDYIPNKKPKTLIVF